MDNLRSVLSRALPVLAEWVAVKTYERYRERLWAAVLRLFNGGRGGAFEATFLRSIDQQLTEAWEKGAASVGIDRDEMTEDDFIILEAIIKNETDFIERLEGDVLAAQQDGMKPEQFARQYGSRVDLWANRYNEVANRAKMHFGSKARLEWRLGATEEHCSTCSQLNGIVAFGYEWDEARLHPQMPPNDGLECEGWRCDCSLEPTTRRRTARALDRLTQIRTAAHL